MYCVLTDNAMQSSKVSRRSFKRKEKIHELERLERKQERENVRRSFFQEHEDHEGHEDNFDTEQDSSTSNQQTPTRFMRNRIIRLVLLILVVGLAILLLFYHVGIVESLRSGWDEGFLEFRDIFHRTEAKLDSEDFTPELNDWIQTQVEKPFSGSVESEAKYDIEKDHDIVHESET